MIKVLVMLYFSDVASLSSAILNYTTESLSILRIAVL